MYKINLLLLLMMSSIFVWGQDPYEDKTESPYFLVHTDVINEKSTPQLPLVSTDTKVKIAGVIADVEIKQTYTNQGSEAIHAEYVFPGSTKSAVYGMEMKIGERVIKAEIKEKQEAKQIFEEAKKEGKNASLLEQERPNIFKMEVANILPNDTIEIILHYTENINPEEGVYEFVYPTAVGPRYVDPSGAVEEWTKNPFVTQNEDGTLASSSTFNLDVDLNTGLPLQEVISPSHQLDIQYLSKESAHIDLKRPEEANKDFILQYRLASEQIESGILIHEGADENFFMMMMEPPKRVTPEQIPPREYIFIIDVSGSMHGFPIETSKVMMRNLLKNLRETDQFNVLLFSSGYSEFDSKPVNATSDNIEEAINFIDKAPGSGGTRLLNALKKSLSMTSNRDISRSFVILTDGYISVEQEAFELISENLGNANFFPIGIGNSVNRHLIEGMAHVGHTLLL